MDDISNMLSQVGGQGSGDPLSSLGGISGALAGVGGLDGLMDKLRGAGLGEAVDSWVGKDDNQELDPAALGQALGPDTRRGSSRPAPASTSPSSCRCSRHSCRRSSTP